MLDAFTIAKTTGCSQAHVDEVWPLVVGALDGCGINRPLVQIAAIATIATETPDFYPVQEKYNGTPEAYFGKLYWQNKAVAHQLGNMSQEDAIAFHGRGLIQITGRDNYELYGELLGVPLAEQPELALDPSVASRILAAFFYRHKVVDAAIAKDWHRVRVRVNGGTNGWSRFISVVNACMENV